MPLLTVACLSACCSTTNEKQTDTIQRLKSIPVRQLNFREAHVADVIHELVRISREDRTEGLGVGILFMDQDSIWPQNESPMSDDPFGGLGSPTVSPSPSSRFPPITLTLSNTNLFEVLNEVCSVGHLKWWVNQEGLIEIRPLSH